jgi:hypothetical protein
MDTGPLRNRRDSRDLAGGRPNGSSADAAWTNGVLRLGLNHHPTLQHSVTPFDHSVRKIELFSCRVFDGGANHFSYLEA